MLGERGCLLLTCALITGAGVWYSSRPTPEYFHSENWWIEKELRALPESHGPGHGRVVLLTGMAGFVGYHTARQLHADGDAVIGLDNFNHYYDVRLKTTRAAHLREEAAAGGAYLRLFEGDVCDGDLLELLLRSGRVTNVIHLAAQAPRPSPLRAALLSSPTAPRPHAHRRACATRSRSRWRTSRRTCAALLRCSRCAAARPARREGGEPERRVVAAARGGCGRREEGGGG